MADLITVSVTISGSAIDLHDQTTYELVEWNAPGITWRLTEVEGDYQPGSRVVRAVPDTSTIAGVVRVKGANVAAVASAAQDLMEALAQFSYTVTEVIDGVTTTYTGCRPADVTPAGGVDARKLSRGRAEYALSIRCDPRSV